MVSITGEKTIHGSHQIDVQADCLFEEMDFSDTEMLVLPGGMPGTKNLEACRKLVDNLHHFYKEGRLIAAICAAPSIFGHMGLLEGKRACIYPEWEDRT